MANRKWDEDRIKTRMTTKHDDAYYRALAARKQGKSLAEVVTWLRFKYSLIKRDFF